MLTLGQSLVDLLGHNLLESLVDLALAISKETSIAAGNPVAQEGHVAQNSRDEEDDREDPDDEGEAHGAQDNSLLVVLLGQSLDLLKEARDGALDSCFLSEKLTLVDGLEGESIDNLARSRAEQDANPCYRVSVKGNLTKSWDNYLEG
jgi:hypothetical protein